MRKSKRKKRRERKSKRKKRRERKNGGERVQLERWGAGVETQKNVLGEIGGWGRVPLNEPYTTSLSTIYDGA